MDGEEGREALGGERGKGVWRRRSEEKEGREVGKEGEGEEGEGDRGRGRKGGIAGPQGSSGILVGVLVGVPSASSERVPLPACDPYYSANQH